MTAIGVDTRLNQPKTERPREWMPRMWEGSDFFSWIHLLARNRFAVQLPYLYIAVIVTFVSFCHTVLRLVQDLIYGREVRRTPIREAPIFIIGHWRTGTTLLHELLILDERHTYPNTYQCLEPNHFLLTEKLITRWLHFLMPSRRPMDNMPAGWDRPQEDEFALCMMGVRSPYLSIAFPNHPPLDEEALDLEGLSPAELTYWKRAFVRFLRHLTYKDPRRLVLKSPTHTCRIKTILELFPDARFIHIMRDPYVVFPSTVNLWKSLHRTHGLQKPNGQGVEEYVFRTFDRMYRKLEEGKKLVRPSHFFELRYEELVKDPVGQMEALYKHLGLGGFEKLLPRLESYLAANAGYRTNKYELTPALEEEVTRRWGWVIRQYGYDEPTARSQ